MKQKGAREREEMKRSEVLLDVSQRSQFVHHRAKKGVGCTEEVRERAEGREKEEVPPEKIFSW
jgi:hypothetical protein